MKLFLASALALATTVVAQIPPPNEAGVTTGHVHLNVKSAAVQKKFWMDHFDATTLKKEGLTGVKVPGFLILFREGPSSGPTEGTVMDHFGFRVRNLQAELKSFRAEGFPILREFTGAEGFPNAYVMGPDGVKVEMQEDTALPVRASINHLHYYAKEVDSLRAWYVTNFGAHNRKRGTLDTTADISTVNLTFMLMKPEDSIVGTKGRSLDHIGFEVKNLEAFCKKLQANGIKLDTPYTKVAALGVGYAYLTDPAGTYIELTEGLTQF